MMGIFVEQDLFALRDVHAIAFDARGKCNRPARAGRVKALQKTALVAGEFLYLTCAADNVDGDAVGGAGLFIRPFQNPQQAAVIAFEPFGKFADILFLLVRDDEEMVAAGFIPLGPGGGGQDKCP